MKRGDVYLVDFGMPDGSEQGGRRPAIILMDDLLIPLYTTVTVVPLTTTLQRVAMPGTVLIRAGEGGLDKDSVALGFQLQVRGKERLGRRLGALSPDRLAEVQEGVLRVLGA